MEQTNRIMKSRSTTVGNYLIQRLVETGLKDVFGVPGDYILGFYDRLTASPIHIVGTCTEAGATFAADAYARVNGLGAVCVTYCVGGLNTLNATAGAYAEKSPLIIISGAPGMNERVRSPLLHHRIRDFDTQRLIFEKITVASAALEDPATAPAQIDQTIAACLRHKRPVYLELPRDMVDRPCPAPRRQRPQSLPRDPDALAEALHEAAAMLRSARRPVILAGIELHRYGLQAPLLRLVERSGYPVASTLLGKSVISELHPQYLGIYEGALGEENTRRAIETSDALLILGAFMTDINLGIYTAHLDVARTIYATSERVNIKHHHFENVPLGEFIAGLTRGNIGRRRPAAHTTRKLPPPFRPQPRKLTTIRRFFARMNDFLEESHVVIADIGDSLFGAADLTIHRHTEFLSPAYYTSMGFAIPAAIGAQIRGNARVRRRRPIVFVGDGGFQMTCSELSTIARHKLNPIIFVLNNQGYTTERFIRDGPYNDIHNWAYHLWPVILQAGWGCEVRTEGELEQALAAAKANTSSFSIINVHFDKWDHSMALERLGKRLGARTRGKK